MRPPLRGVCACALAATPAMLPASAACMPPAVNMASTSRRLAPRCKAPRIRVLSSGPIRPFSCLSCPMLVSCRNQFAGREGFSEALEHRAAKRCVSIAPERLAETAVSWTAGGMVCGEPRYSPTSAGKPVDVTNLREAPRLVGPRLMAAVDEHLVHDTQVLGREDVVARVGGNVQEVLGCTAELVEHVLEGLQARLVGAASCAV